MNNKPPSVYVLIVAAGNGFRYNDQVSKQAARPKQYALINDKTVLEHSIDAFIGLATIAGITVVLNKDDRYWQQLKLSEKLVGRLKIRTAVGGEQRSHSVINGLEKMQLKDPDWVLVHDAARPCVRAEDIEKLIRKVIKTETGGLLVKPVVDTIKFSDDKIHSSKTVDRGHLFSALTPQMFKYGQLLNILSKENPYTVTDEASAFEQAGKRPLMVTGHNDNIKITQGEDLQLAEYILKKQGRIV
ncbi:MAG: 2-C-methyl-D-erythritol 4-phosphate cytidylyltransferase [Proteobacteria bacterium]|nr:2-C-methyl-D-erythritol 4-phosphate cytidylyltransferase [Pseudomonadota bacterium]